MKVTRVSVEVLRVPVDRPYVAGGRAVDANWHVLARLTTSDGVQGVGYPTRCSSSTCLVPPVSCIRCRQSRAASSWRRRPLVSGWPWTKGPSGAARSDSGYAIEAGTMGGILSVHGAATSKAAAALNTAASWWRRPTIWSPTGSPLGVNPQGTEIAGRPVSVMA